MSHRYYFSLKMMTTRIISTYHMMMIQRYSSTTMQLSSAPKVYQIKEECLDMAVDDNCRLCIPTQPKQIFCPVPLNFTLM